jgi:hypothetical protein
MITLITGQPGAGKSMYAVKLVVDELLSSDRDIITNLSIYKLRVYKYCFDKYRKEIDINRIIQIENPADFLKYRKKESLIILDECQTAFNARAWKETSKEVIDYLSQHRKLGDDVILITQDPGLIDKQFRLLVTNSFFLKNLKYLNLGIFNLPKKIVRLEYFGIPDRQQKPLSKAVMDIDVQGLGWIYDTGAGVGVKGAGDVNFKKRGKLPFWLFPVVFFVFLGLVGYAVIEIPKLGIKKVIEKNNFSISEAESQEKKVEKNLKKSEKNVDKNEITNDYVVIKSYAALPGGKAWAWDENGNRYEVFSDFSRLPYLIEKSGKLLKIE